MKRIATLLIAGLAAALPVTGAADATIEMRSGDEPDDKLVMRVKDRMTRWDQGGSERHTVLFNADSRTLTIVNHGERSYMELDEARVKGVSDKMSAMMKQMEAQLANLPKEQREMLMERMPGFKRPESVSYSAEKTGGSDTVNGFRCDNYEVNKNGQPYMKACVSSHKTLGISSADFDTLATMFEAMKDMASQFSGSDDMMPLRELGGLPVRSKTADGGETSEIVAVNDDRLDGELFAVDASYKPQQMPNF